METQTEDAQTCLVAETCEKNDMVWSDPNVRFRLPQ
jgi:hypothetical protein